MSKPFAIGLALGVHLALGWSAFPALQSGVYQTVPDAMVREWGDRVPNGSRDVPLFATLTFDLSSAPALLTAVITNAVLEGGEPFALTVRSSLGSQLPDGTCMFTGDYLRDIYPSGTQYLFDWRFSASTNGKALWNGMTGWAGGHAWYVTISNITMVPVAWLDISRVGTSSVQMTWSTNFADYVLEYTTGLSSVNWGSVTNRPIIVDDRLSVTLETGVANRFFRLRKP